MFERVKSVMQVQKAGAKAPYSWSGECVVQLIRKEGLYHGLFRGLDATVAREIPQFAVYYPGTCARSVEVKHAATRSLPADRRVA